MSKSEWNAYLRVLGLPGDTTRAELQTSYRKLALRYHPDVNRDADANSRFRLISEAFRSLDEYLRLKDAGDSGDVAGAVGSDPAIAKIGSARLRRYLRQSPFWQIRISAAVALSLRDEGRGALTEAIQDPDRRVRETAAGIITERLDPKDIGRLLANLKVKNIDTWTESIRTAFQIVQKRWRDPEFISSGAPS